ncbi:MAG: DNA repair ATPase [Nitrospinaceae bacterium]|nr:MAG: DNA repair ATPase [Nitrospinaceae bacterium]
MHKRSVIFFMGWLILLLFFSGCQTVYYNTMEKLGTHKREILADRIEGARDSQLDAKEQFNSALEQFSATLKFKGGTLEEKYKKLNGVYEKSEAKANDVKDRIEKVEHVAGALFEEWEEELGQYTNIKLRNNSEVQLNATKKRYGTLIKAMKRAEKKIKPVLSALNNQVLTLKHNLNAAAIASLQKELVEVETDVASLVKEMEAAIKEANSFLETMTQDGNK